jgi:long-subunit acyl-CoA synthetase (AMP-forming)
LEHSLSLTTPRAVFFSASTQDAVMEALSSLKARPLLVRLPDEDGEDEGGDGFETLSHILSSVPQQNIATYTPYKPADPAECVGLIMCSSGTTGMPKGVQLSHTNLLAGICNPR